ncbi:ParB N-terminal domain-containing protein [Methylopila sp. Yamaguchi]|uniref:ParB N-terminal domain-containing protein n=1 Tax=Methylopila sp. Yamaguchi TaxID=1437817 RepID=UPI000CBFCDB3|nr:ParB N-terminal domain-containing protein [Methylopila sp. Yamaguchi]GBD48142.1 hypothetical protein METY_1355 [Methylopila sp. Yamaguchi]
MTELAVGAIRADSSAQPRAALNYDVVNAYAQDMAEGAVFPPLVVFREQADGVVVYWLADGFHRHAAAGQARLSMVEVDIRKGGLRDAVLFSVGANAQHGLQRSIEDKRRAVRRLLDDGEWSLLSDREIARRCRVTHPFVSKLRAEFAPRVETLPADPLEIGSREGREPAAAKEAEVHPDAPPTHRGNVRQAAPLKPEARRPAADLIADILALGEAVEVDAAQARAAAGKLLAWAELAEGGVDRAAAPGTCVAVTTTQAPSLSVGAQPVFALEPVSPLSGGNRPARRQKGSYTEQFEEFWLQYPLNRGKKPAAAAYAKAIANGASPMEMLQGAMRYAAECAANGTPDNKIKHAQGWLNDERWTDAPQRLSRPGGDRPLSRVQSALEGLAAFGEP